MYFHTFSCIFILLYCPLNYSHVFFHFHCILSNSFAPLLFFSHMTTNRIRLLHLYSCTTWNIAHAHRLPQSAVKKSVREREDLELRRPAPNLQFSWPADGEPVTLTGLVTFFCLKICDYFYSLISQFSIPIFFLRRFILLWAIIGSSLFYSPSSFLSPLLFSSRSDFGVISFV